MIGRFLKSKRLVKKLTPAQCEAMLEQNCDACPCNLGEGRCDGECIDAEKSLKKKIKGGKL